MQPDVVTTLPVERLLRPRDYSPNTTVLPKPFGRYERFLVRTGLVVNKPPGPELRLKSTEDLKPILQWVVSKPPCSIVVCVGPMLQLRAVHRADPSLKDIGPRAVVLSAMSNSKRVFIGMNVEEELSPDRFAELDLAMDVVEKSKVEVIDCFITGSDGAAFSRTLWMPVRPSFGSSKAAVESVRVIEDNFACRLVLGRSQKWTGRPGPLFGRALIEDACSHMIYDDQETIVGFSFDDDRRLVAINEIARGAADHAVFTVQDALKVPILTGAQYLAVVHNHPSGVPIPSQDDVIMTRGLRSVSNDVGVEFLGSFIVGREGPMQEV